MEKEWKNCLAAIGFMLMLSVSGCGAAPLENTVDEESESAAEVFLQDMEDGENEIVNICLDLYRRAAEENKTVDLETVRSIVNRFGENGYSAVDSKNQIDMTEAEQVMQFCKMVDGETEINFREINFREITVIEVDYLGGFAKYDLQAADGNIDVTRSYYKYKNGTMKREAERRYRAEEWEYTQEGYLMISGVWFSEESYLLTLSGAEEHIALRVEPLDEVYRELNRKYLLPIGYARNNMFLSDWSEDDFGELNFYDMYDILYPKVNGKQAPYAANDNFGVDTAYQIPKDAFERVIMPYFNIDSETLRSKTSYDSENSAYQYKPRGFYEVEYLEYPYPEVVDFTKNSDGTMTLTVNVVFPYEGNSKVYAHEVTVRPLENGGVQYVSNRIIPSEENQEGTWHTPRST